MQMHWAIKLELAADAIPRERSRIFQGDVLLAASRLVGASLTQLDLEQAWASL